MRIPIELLLMITVMESRISFHIYALFHKQNAMTIFRSLCRTRVNQQIYFLNLLPNKCYVIKTHLGTPHNKKIVL